MIWNAGDSLELTLHGLAHDGAPWPGPKTGRWFLYEAACRDNVSWRG